MKAIRFPQANVDIAKNQSEYRTLPAEILTNQTTVLFEFSDRDIQRVVKNKIMWLTFLKDSKQPFTPFSGSFAKDFYDDMDPEPRWWDQSENIPAYQFKKVETLHKDIKLSFIQRIQCLFFGNVRIKVKLTAYSRYEEDIMFTPEIKNYESAY